MLKIYNTLTRRKQDFVPIEPGRVRMYVCGMTVYDYCHLGHARFMLVFDMVQRWLRASGFDVTYVRNITDIDDKIIRRAVENGEPIGALTERFIRYMDEDAAALGMQKPDYEPRATKFIDDMQEIIKVLQVKGLAYQGASGDVNYAVRKFPGLRQALRASRWTSCARASASRSIRASRTRSISCCGSMPRRASRRGPRPGAKAARAGTSSVRQWRANCSARTSTFTAAARTCSSRTTRTRSPSPRRAFGGTFANYWMHNGFVRVDEEKMSKSLGNFFTIREVLQRYDAEVVRFFILRAHYRSPLNYSDHNLEDARQALARLYTALNAVAPAVVDVDWSEPSAARFKQAMDDDFDTPEAVAVLFELGRRGEPRPFHAQRGAAEVAGRRSRVTASAIQAFLQDAPSRPEWTPMRNRAADCRARGGAKGEKLRRVRPHPQGIAGCRS